MEKPASGTSPFPLAVAIFLGFFGLVIVTSAAGKFLVRGDHAAPPTAAAATAPPATP
jgi:hypothetical protein